MCYLFIRKILLIYIYLIISLPLGLLSRYPKELNVTWNAVVQNPIDKHRWHSYIQGDTLLQFLHRNYTIKVFEKLNASMKRKNMSRKKALSLKLDIFNDYSHPKPFPKDMYLRLPNGSPNQAYLILGTKGTGNKLLRLIGFKKKKIKTFDVTDIV